MPLPNFICPGAQKAGTSSLHDILVQHPDIYLPEIKETKFFHLDRLHTKGAAYYEQQFFSAWQGQKAIGEIDPSYMFFDHVPERLFRVLGRDIKLIFLLRDPVERAFSQYYHGLRMGSERSSFEEAVRAVEEGREDAPFITMRRRYITRGYYASQIKRYLKLFPIDNMLFIIFETDFLKNREETIGRILDLLGVERLPLDVNIKSNAASSSRSRVLKRLINKPNSLRDAAKILLPSRRLRKGISSLIERLNDKKTEKTTISPDLRKHLLDRFFMREIRDLEELIQKDLRHWHT